ncbi:MAG: SRPBCC family protein [Planctomycetota bacterium]
MPDDSAFCRLIHDVRSGRSIVLDHAEEIRHTINTTDHRATVKPIRILRTIVAPLDVVFHAVSDVRNFREAVPQITNVEFLSEQQVGTGTRFRETRVMKGREQTVELEVAEYIKNERVRMISDAGGTVWDTVFNVSANRENVELDMQMNVRPYTLIARIMTPLIRGMVEKAVESDMDAVKAFCESQHEQA